MTTRSWQERLSSRKFILAMLAQLTGIAVLVLPGYENEIAQASEHIGAMLLMAITGLGWIKAEANVDSFTQLKSQVPGFAVAAVLSASMLSGCAAWNQATLLQKYAASQETYITVLQDLLALRTSGIISEENWQLIVVPLINEGDVLLDKIKLAADAGDEVSFEIYWETLRNLTLRLIEAQNPSTTDGVTTDEPSSRYRPDYQRIVHRGFAGRQPEDALRAYRPGASVPEDCFAQRVGAVGNRAA